MIGQWLDYKYGSWLVLTFGSVDIKIVLLDVPASVWGIIINPDQKATFTGTLDGAKAKAEVLLEENLTAALQGLQTAKAARIAGRVTT